MLYLARQDGGGPVPADRIAEALGAPANYLAKTLQVLAREGVVEGLRGPGGGFRLAVPAETLTLARVVEPFDETRSRTVCLLGDRPCRDDEPCEAHRRWTEIVRRSRALLEATTVAELVAGPVPAPPGPVPIPMHA